MPQVNEFSWKLSSFITLLYFVLLLFKVHYLSAPSWVSNSSLMSLKPFKSSFF